MRPSRDLALRLRDLPRRGPTAWASALGTIDTVGIEGTGAYGAGLCRWLRERGVVVVEVERPDRKLRRTAGKFDPIDAEAAARKVSPARRPSHQSQVPATSR